MNEIIFYEVESTSHTVDDLIDSFYPEFACDERKRPAIKGAIHAMNEHLGLNEFGSLSFLSWVVMPDYDSYIYKNIAENTNLDVFDVSWSAQSQILGVPYISWNHDIGHIMRHHGPAKVFAISKFAHDWWGGFKENLAESPLKNSIKETSTYFIEKMGEHGAEVFMATRSLDSSLKKFVSVSGKEARQLAKKEVIEAHKKLSHELPKVVKSIVNHYSHKTHISPSNARGLRAIDSVGSALRSANKLSKSKSFVISSSEYTKMIKVMKYGKYVGDGFLVLDVATDSIDVLDAYNKGEDWQELAFENGCGMLGSIFIGGLGGFLGGLTGPGAIILAPVGAIGGSIMGEKAGQSICKLAYKIL